MAWITALKEKAVWKKTAPAILLVLNSFVWYILINTFFASAVNALNFAATEKLCLFGIYFVSIAASALIGAKFFPRRRITMLCLWFLLGTASTLLLTTIPTNGLVVNGMLAVFLGFSIGIGLPSCLSYFADSTFVENRGLIGGITWSGVGFAVLSIALLISTLSQLVILIVLALWRLLTGIGFMVLTRKHAQLSTQKFPRYIEVIRKRETLLYWVPWVMFAIVNFTEMPILERAFNSVFGQDFFVFLQLAEFAFIGIFAVIGGAIADIAGRKKVVITGFIMLGIEYAMISVFSITSITGYLFLILDGITWGLLFSVFFTVLWGDLGENQEKEKYYVLGGLPYLLAGFLPIVMRPYVEGVATGTAFSFASFFLFIAVIPLMYAPETLPEKTLKDRNLKSYIEKAQKIAEKQNEKNEINSSDKTENEKKDEAKESPEDEETRKLAEKYY
jgi:MFS family permease